MSNYGFDSIAQAMLKQKQLMDELENENRELRRQIADLRAGYGIFIEVEGKRFPIKGEMAVAQASPVLYDVQQNFLTASTPPILPEEPVSPMNERNAIVAISPTLEMSPAAEFSSPLEEEQEQEKAPTFLEEIMIDEFAAASTSPMSVWQGPSEKQAQAQIDEEKKAALRRELMGSFLLE